MRRNCPACTLTISESCPFDQVTLHRELAIHPQISTTVSAAPPHLIAFRIRGIRLNTAHCSPLEGTSTVLPLRALCVPSAFSAFKVPLSPQPSYLTSPRPFSIRPITDTRSPLLRSVSATDSANVGRTIRQYPIPMLNTRRISSAATSP